jgi:MFS family permease
MLADLLQSIDWSKPASLQIALLIAGIVSIAAIVPLFYIREKRNLEDVEKIEHSIEHSIENTAQNTSQESIVKRSATSALSTAASSEWKIIGIITFAQLLVGFGSGLVVPYLNLYFTDRFSMSLSAVGLLISLGQIMTIFSMLIGPKLVHRVGQVNAVVIFQLLSLPFLLLTGFTNLVLVASVTFLFRQALMNAANPIQSAILVDKISDNRRSIANSLTQAVFMLGWASMGQVQPRLITAYGTYWGYVVTFSLTGVLYVSAALYFYFMIGRRNRNTITSL